MCKLFKLPIENFVCKGKMWKSFPFKNGLDKTGIVKVWLHALLKGDVTTAGCYMLRKVRVSKREKGGVSC